MARSVMLASMVLYSYMQAPGSQRDPCRLTSTEPPAEPQAENTSLRLPMYPERDRHTYMQAEAVACAHGKAACMGCCGSHLLQSVGNISAAHSMSCEACNATRKLRDACELVLST